MDPQVNWVKKFLGFLFADSKWGNRTMAIEDEDEDEDSMALLPFGFGSASISTVGSFIRSPQCGGPPPITSTLSQSLFSCSFL